jgi:hypothetical protein
MKDTYFVAAPPEALDGAHTALTFAMTLPTGERLNEFCLSFDESSADSTEQHNNRRHPSVTSHCLLSPYSHSIVPGGLLVTS